MCVCVLVRGREIRWRLPTSKHRGKSLMGMACEGGVYVYVCEGGRREGGQGGGFHKRRGGGGANMYRVGGWVGVERGWEGAGAQVVML